MENLELYYGNKVQVTMQDGTCKETCKEGILFPGDTGQLVLKNEVNEDILLRDDVKDVRYVGYITDYKTREDKVILDNAISFKFSKVKKEDLSKKIKYEEFVCEVYAYLEFDEKTKKIVAKVSDMELKSSVHVVNNKLLEERFLYKFAGEDGWKPGYLQERDEKYTFYEINGTEKTEPKDIIDVIDVTKIPMTNDCVEVKVRSEDDLIIGTVGAVCEDCFFVVQKNDKQFKSYKVSFKDLVEVRYSGKITYVSEKQNFIDHIYCFKEPYLKADSNNRVINGNKADFTVGINNKGLIAKDVVVDQTLIVYKGILLTSSNKGTYYIGTTLGRESRNQVKGGINCSETVLKNKLGDEPAVWGSSNQYMIVQYTLKEQGKEVAHIEKYMKVNWGKYESIIKVNDTDAWEEEETKILLMQEHYDHFKGKYVTITDKYGNKYSGTCGEKCSDDGITLKETENEILWKNIDEIRCFGVITSVKEKGDSGSIDRKYAYFGNCSFKTEVGMKVSYELVYSTEKKEGALRCDNIKLWTEEETVYITQKKGNEYTYVKKDDVDKGEKTFSYISDNKLPDIDKLMYGAKLIWMEINGEQKLKEIKLIEGDVKDKEIGVSGNDNFEGKISLPNEKVYDVTKGESVLVESENEIFFGTATEVTTKGKDKEIKVKRAGNDTEIIIKNKDKVYRFGLLTKIEQDKENKEWKYACLSNHIKFPFSMFDSPGDIRTEKKQKMLLYAQDAQEKISKAYRVSYGIDSTMNKNGKVRSYGIKRSADFIPWQLGKVVDCEVENSKVKNSKVKTMIIETNDINVRYHITKATSTLIKDAKSLIGKEVYVKLVSYPCEINSKPVLITDAIEVYPKQAIIKLEYQESKEWKVIFHDTLKVDVEGEEEYLWSRNGKYVSVSFIPKDDDSAVLKAVVERKIVARVKELEEEFKKTNYSFEEGLLDEYSYLAGLMLKGGNKLYIYRLFVFVMYNTDIIIDKYEDSISARFDVEAAWKTLFTTEMDIQKRTIMYLVRHFATIEDIELGDSKKKYDEKYKEICKQYNVQESSHEGLRRLCWDVRENFVKELDQAINCSKLRKAINVYLDNSENEMNKENEAKSGALRFFTSKLESDFWKKVEDWCIQVENGCSNKDEYEQHKKYSDEIKEKLKLLQENKKDSNIEIQELLLDKGTKDLRSILQLVKEALRNNMYQYMQQKPPVIKCVIPGNSIIAGRSEVPFYVQNYDENHEYLMPARDVNIKVTISNGEKNKEVCSTIRKLGGKRGEDNLQWLDPIKGIEYDAETKYVTVNVELKYKEGDNSEEKTDKQEIKVAIVKPVETFELNPYRINAAGKDRIFYGRTDEKAEITEVIFDDKDKLRDGAILFIYGQKQCGKTYLMQSFYNAVSGKMLNSDGEEIEKSKVLYFPMFTNLIAGMEGANAETRLKAIRWGILKELDSTLGQRKTEEETNTFNELNEFLTSRIGKKTNQKSATDNNSTVKLPAVTGWEDATEENFKEFVNTYRKNNECSIVLIFDEFTDYCDMLRKLKNEEKLAAIKFIFEFSESGFVQIFIGHEEMHSLIYNSGLTNKLTAKNKTMHIQELDPKDAREMIKVPMKKVLNYQPYEGLSGQAAVEKLLRLSGCNPKILCDLCTIMYNHLKKNCKELRYLTEKDVDEETAIEKIDRHSLETIFEPLLRESTDSADMQKEVKACLYQLTANSGLNEFIREIKIRDDDKSETKINVLKKLEDRGVVSNGRIKVGWFEDYIKKYCKSDF